MTCRARIARLLQCRLVQVNGTCIGVSSVELRVLAKTFFCTTAGCGHVEQRSFAFDVVARQSATRHCGRCDGVDCLREDVAQRILAPVQELLLCDDADSDDSHVGADDDDDDDDDKDDDFIDAPHNDSNKLFDDMNDENATSSSATSWQRASIATTATRTIKATTHVPRAAPVKSTFGLRSTLLCRVTNAYQIAALPAALLGRRLALLGVLATRNSATMTTTTTTTTMMRDVEVAPSAPIALDVVGVQRARRVGDARSVMSSLASPASVAGEWRRTTQFVDALGTNVVGRRHFFAKLYARKAVDLIRLCACV